MEDEKKWQPTLLEEVVGGPLVYIYNHSRPRKNGELGFFECFIGGPTYTLLRYYNYCQRDKKEENV